MIDIFYWGSPMLLPHLKMWSQRVVLKVASVFLKYSITYEHIRLLSTRKTWENICCIAKGGQGWARNMKEILLSRRFVKCPLKTIHVLDTLPRRISRIQGSQSHGFAWEYSLLGGLYSSSSGLQDLDGLCFCLPSQWTWLTYHQQKEKPLSWTETWRFCLGSNIYPVLQLWVDLVLCFQFSTGSIYLE